jgi:hypothetical protein
MESTVKRFRMSEFIKDGHLAEALRNEMAELKGDQLVLAQEAITDIATAGMPGTFDELLGSYKRAIRRALHPERKLVKSPQIDRKIIKNPVIAAALDKELRDVTQPELEAANAAVKAVLDEAREVQVIRGKSGEERFVTHEPSDICQFKREHSTLPNGDIPGCGYFRDPAEWADILRGVVRAAVA